MGSADIELVDYLIENNIDNNFFESLKTGYIDKSIESDISYVPEIITNDFNKPQKVLTTLINSLNNCESFS